MFSLKKGQDKLGYLKTLAAIYRFESTRVSGPGSYRRDIRDTLWTLDNLMEVIASPDISRKGVEILLGRMQKTRNLMVVEDQETGAVKYTTRVAETIRVLGHCYEYWYRGRSGVDALRWIAGEKHVPVRSIPADEFISRLKQEMSDVSQEHLNLPGVIEQVVTGIAKYLSKQDNDWGQAHFSEFQFRSTVEMLRAQYDRRHKTHTQILTAGVGAGKTISFLIATFISSLEALRNSPENDIRTHLLLYPRTALAHDQHRTVSGMAEKIHPGITVLFDHASYYRSIGMSVKAGIMDKYGYRHPPSIIITTLETLKRRLQNPFVLKKISGHITRVVLDEIHLVNGLTGSHVTRLLQRLKAINRGTFIFWTSASATVAAPDSHAAMVFGVHRRQVAIISPLKGEFTASGIAHHVFLRPSPLMSTMGTLVNATSLLVHSRRSQLHELHSRRNPSRNPKTIGFADNLDILGRWNSDLRENERTEKASDREHPEETSIKRWKHRAREIPYALRYITPLTRRIEAKRGKNSGDEFEPVLPQLKGSDPCATCREEGRIEPVKCSEEDLYKLGRFVQRHPTKSDDPAKRFNIRSNVFRGARAINTLDQCPYLQAGACLWFADADFKIEKIEGTKAYEYRNVVRSRIYSSKTKREIQEDVDLSSTVFKAPTKEVYGVPRSFDGALVPCDIVLSSPSLEVGIDLTNVTESIMFKAIRNVASYRQKAGRAGREQGSDAINVTLLSQSPIDLHYYRQPRKLTSLAQLDPIPLEDKNQSILLSSLYCAVWDYLAFQDRIHLPEIIPYDGKFTDYLKSCIVELNRSRHRVEKHLSRVSGKKLQPDASEAQEAIDIVIRELEFLTLSVVGVFKQDSIKTLADVIVSYLSRYSKQAILRGNTSQPFNMITNGEKAYWGVRPYISPIQFQMVEEFQVLDKMATCGWDATNLNSNLGTLKSNLDSLDPDSYTYMDLKKVCDALDEVRFGLKELDSVGLDSRVVSFFNQFRDLYNHQKPKAYYLSFILQELPVFQLLRTNPSYVSPKNLFMNPYDFDVLVSGLGQKPESVSLSEVLFSFIPGTWSYRWGSQPFKTLVGTLDSEIGDILIADLNKITTSCGSVFVPERMNVANPLGEEGDKIDVYRPVRLAVKRVGKYQRCHPGTGVVIDRDEGEPGKPGRLEKIKIPKSFIARWVAIEATEGEAVRCQDTGTQALFIDTRSGKIKGDEAIEKIKHPLFGGLIESTSWHENLEATDYVHSVLRFYSKPKIGGRSIVFTHEGNRIAIGRSLNTKGVSIDLNAETLEEVVDNIVTAIMAGDLVWLPTALKALSASLIEGQASDEMGATRFAVRDLIGSLLVSTYPDFEELKAINLLGMLRNLVESDGLESAARKYYRSRGAQEIPLSDTDEPERQDEEDIGTRVAALLSTARKLVDSLPELERNLQQVLRHWLIRTLLNTFGDAAVTALQRLAGVTNTEVGYTLSIEDNCKRYRVYLYDRDQYGNGSSRVLKEFFHILHVQRYTDFQHSYLLPTYDYTTLLEEQLLQCTQFLQDMNALMMFETLDGDGLDAGYSELEYLNNHSREVIRVGKKVWRTLGICGVKDAWKLPLLNIISGYVAEKHQGIETDDVIRATGICWNGCPECMDARGGVMGAIAGLAFIDKAVLDHWFRSGRCKASEYKTTQLSQLRGDTSIIEIGAKSRLGIEHDDGVILRSVALPHTIGFEIDRKNPHTPVSIVIRDNDVLGLSLQPKKKRTSWHGIPAQGFRRLIWHTLLTTAFLDSMESIEEKDKEIWLVYFNLRNLDFIDVGMTGRAMEVIEHCQGRATSSGPIQSLSDVLVWLANRGFRVKVCTDQQQLQERSNPRGYIRVRELLTRLANTEGIEVLTKDFPAGIMHKKGLRTPIGIVSGSANLTYGGSTWNEEDISYFLPIDAGYEDLAQSFQDTLLPAKLWRPGD